MEEFVARCARYFAGAGLMIDQPVQPQLDRGMVRCYLVGNKVAGFGHQTVNLLLPPPPGSSEPPTPTPRTYVGPSEPRFQGLKRRMEAEWVPEMQGLLGVPDDSLPALWDADFLFGPGAGQEESFLLGEINVSSVHPFPVEATSPLADAALRGASHVARSR